MKNALWIKLGVILGACLILCIPLFYNGYPLMHEDSAIYIDSGKNLILPDGRTIIYGLIIRFLSLGNSLFLVPVFQNIVLAFLLYKIFVRIIGSIHLHWFIFLVFILSIASTAAWFSSGISPDIWMAVLILGIIFLLIRKETKTLELIIIYLLLVFSSITHFSHLWLFVSFNFCLFAISFVPGIKLNLRRKRIIELLALSIVSVVLIPAINKSLNNPFELRYGSHIYSMGRLLDNGILSRYLEEKCDDEMLSLCAYQDSLPTNSKTFISDYENSPLYKEGGWDKVKDEYQSIILHTFINPKYLLLNLFQTVKATCIQFAQIDLKINDSANNSLNHNTIAKYFPHELQSYLHARQQTMHINRMSFGVINALNYFLYIVSILVLIYFFSQKTKNPLFARIFLICIFITLLNAMITGSLANINGHLQARISFIIPLFVMLYLLKEFLLKKESQEI